MPNILVVDDERSIRLSVRQFLKDAGYQAYVAQDATQAMERLSASDVDVVLADVILPRVTGVSLLKSIRKVAPHVKVILMTGEPTVTTASEAVRSGAFDYLIKPIAKERLLKTVAGAVKVRMLEEERRRLEMQNQQYQRSLEQLIEQRTDALRRSDERLRLAQRVSRMGTWEWNVATKDVLWSDEVVAMWGYEPGQFTGTLDEVAARVHPDDLERWRESMRACVEDGIEHHLELRVLWPDGSVRWVEAFGDAERTDDGKALRMMGVVMDVTERKRAEQELRKSEATARALVNAPVDTVLLLDANGIVQDCNEALIRGFSASRDEVVGSCIWDKFAPDVTARRKACADKVMQTGEPVRFEDERNGIWYDNTLYPVFDHRQKVTGVAVIARHITEWRQAQQDLQDSEERFRAIFEQAAVGVALIDIATGEFLRVNRKYADILGLTPEEITATTFMAITHPDDLQEDLDNVERLKAGTIREFSMEKRYCRKDGSIVWVNLTVSPMRAPGQQPTSHIAVVEDITNRKYAEQALRESESRLREAQQMAHLGHWFWDVKTGNVEWSREVYNIFQLKPEEFTPQIDSILALSPWPEDNQRDKELIQRAIDSHEPGAYEQRFLRPDGSTGYYYSTFQGVYDDQGNLIAIKGTVQDTTERKQAEQKLLAYQNQLKSLASELTLTEERLRRNIATQLHDQISQSLVLSRFKLESLRDAVSQDAPRATLEEVRRVLSKTLEDSRHLTSELSYPILNVMGLEAAVGEWVLEEIQQKHGIVTAVDDDAQPKPLDEDVRAVLFRGVRELLMNVVKHARATRVKITMRREGDRIVIRVKDNGIGLATNGRFWQEQSGGFGLLSVVEAMERLGGQLHIESQPGAGCLATLTAPLNPKGQSAKQAQS